MSHFKRFLRVFIFIICLSAANSRAFAQGIHFVYNLDSALALAKAENKPIFIDFYTSWCAPCKVMTNEVFPQEKVGKFFNKQFINCKIQCDDKGIGVEIGNKYQVTAYPTLMFLDAGGKLIHSAAGSLSADEFIDLASIALNPEKNLMSLIKKWDAGERDTAFVNKYFYALKEAYRKELAKSQFEVYFNELSKKDKTSKNTFGLIKLLSFTPFSPIFSFVEDNKKSFYKSVGGATIDKYLSDSYTWYLQAMSMGRGTAAHNDYLAAKAKFKAKNYPNYNEVAMFLEVFETFDSTGKVDIKEYQRRGTAFLDKYGANNDSYTLSLTSLLGNCTGRENEGAEGIKWMENLMARNNDPKFLRLYFYIVLRNYQIDKAREIGQTMRNNAIRNNEPTKDVDQQIASIEQYKAAYEKRKSAGSQTGGKTAM